MENTQVKTIDVTPTWSGMLPVLLYLVENATTAEAKNTAYTELSRMAEMADAAVQMQKAE
jgi:hypothetical protein